MSVIHIIVSLEIWRVLDHSFGISVKHKSAKENNICRTELHGSVITKWFCIVCIDYSPQNFQGLYWLTKNNTKCKTCSTLSIRRNFGHEWNISCRYVGLFLMTVSRLGKKQTCYTKANIVSFSSTPNSTSAEWMKKAPRQDSHLTILRWGSIIWEVQCYATGLWRQPIMKFKHLLPYDDPFIFRSPPPPPPPKQVTPDDIHLADVMLNMFYINIVTYPTSFSQTLSVDYSIFSWMTTTVTLSENASRRIAKGYDYQTVLFISHKTIKLSYTDATIQ